MSNKPLQVIVLPKRPDNLPNPPGLMKIEEEKEKKCTTVEHVEQKSGMVQDSVDNA